MKALVDAVPFAGIAMSPPARGVRVERPAPAVAALDEAALCALAMTGDRDAWSALVQRHNHRVVVTLLGRGVRIDRAKDVAQEAWMRLVEQQKAGKLDRLQLPGLAITQAVFLSLEAARRESGVRKHEPLDEPAIAAVVADPRDDAERRLLTEERVEQAVEVLSGCSDSAKKVFRLAYGGDGLSHAEVAARVGLSLQRVRQILCEVRAKLRTALEGAEES
jgi:RNA polymerase sigma-70 factor (ECF subfamily)